MKRRAADGYRCVRLSHALNVENQLDDARAALPSQDVISSIM
jgi:hypothetical protein